MKVTRGDPAGAIHFKPFAQWELHDGAASDDSVKTEALHSPSGEPALHAPSPPPFLCERGLIMDLTKGAVKVGSAILSLIVDVR